MKTITYSDYFDKAYGCWLGKSIGGACGALSENNKDILHYTLDNVFPDSIPPNDDLDLQVLWLVDLLEKKGTAITAHDFAKSRRLRELLGRGRAGNSRVCGGGSRADGSDARQ